MAERRDEGQRTVIGVLALAARLAEATAVAFGTWLMKGGGTVLYLDDNRGTAKDGDQVQALDAVELALSC